MTLNPPQGNPWDGDDGLVEFTCDEQFGLICNATATWAGPAAHREALRRRGLLTTANIIGTVKTSAADARKLESYHLADWAARNVRAHADRIVRDHWADIERLAAALWPRRARSTPTGSSTWSPSEENSASRPRGPARHRHKRDPQNQETPWSERLDQGIGASSVKGIRGNRHPEPAE